MEGMILNKSGKFFVLRLIVNYLLPQIHINIRITGEIPSGEITSGCLKVPINNSIENVHIQLCKDLLGVQRLTSNIGVILELGRMTIILHGKKQCNKNWERIHITRRVNEIGWSHFNSIENQLKRSLSVTDCLNRRV